MTTDTDAPAPELVDYQDCGETAEMPLMTMRELMAEGRR